MGEPGLERRRVDEVRERALAVDLDHREVLPVPRLELAIATDVHDEELEPELLLRLVHDLERPLAEDAALGAVEGDPPVAYG